MHDIPDLISTLSTFPYLLNSLSTSDCRASKSRFPQKTGLISRNFEARNLLKPTNIWSWISCFKKFEIWHGHVWKFDSTIADLLLNRTKIEYSYLLRLCDWQTRLNWTDCELETFYQLAEISKIKKLLGLFGHIGKGVVRVCGSGCCYVKWIFLYCWNCALYTIFF